MTPQQKYEFWRLCLLLFLLVILGAVIVVEVSKIL